MATRATPLIGTLLAVCALNQNVAALYMNGLFTDHAVLQLARPELDTPQARLYGTADVNETVHISGTNGFKTMSATPTGAKSGDGNWSVTVEMPEGNQGPFNITVTSVASNGTVTDNITFGDVYFGDVIVCSGQSNMGYSLDHTDNATAEIAAANNYPNMRIFTVGLNWNNATTPIALNGSWLVVSNQTAGHFSAVCYIAGRMLADWLHDTKPKQTSYLGLILSAVGGTSVYLWAPPPVSIACNSTGILPSTGQVTQHPPGLLWTNMVNPISHNGTGFPIMAVIYYQGEADSGENDLMTPDAYTCEMTNMVHFWRLNWNQTQLPFVIIELPGTGSGGCNPGSLDGDVDHWPGIRAAQQRTLQLVDGCGLVTSMDTGGPLHYPHKSGVSERAMLWIRRLAFGDSTAQPRGPQLLFAGKASQGVSDVQLYFSSEAGGLQLSKAWNCDKIAPCIWPGVNVTCCDGGAPSIVYIRLQGYYYYSGWAKANEPPVMIGLWSWLPAKLSVDAENLVITATPLIPAIGTQNFPTTNRNLLGVGIYSIEEVVMNANWMPGCTISDKNGVPAGGYDPIPVVIMPPSKLIRRSFKTDSTDDLREEIGRRLLR